MNAKKKFIASLCALLFAVSVAAGSAYAWLTAGDYAAQFRVGFAQVSVAGSLGAQSFFVRSENAEAETELAMACGGMQLTLDNAGTGAVGSLLVVDSATVAQAKAANAKLTVDGTEYVFGDLGEGIELAVSLGGLETGAGISRALALEADEGFVLKFAIRVY